MTSSSQRPRLAGLTLCLGLAASPAASTPVVSTIEVQGNERTLVEVIRRELLFDVGDRIDSLLIDETERNLRRLLYLGRAHIRTLPAAPGSVAVVVDVEDLYSRAVSPLLSGNTDEISFGAVALDYNLFGRGQMGQLNLFHDAVSGNRATGLYRNPRLGGSRLRLGIEAGWAQEGHRASLSITQPFYELRATWAYGVALSSSASRARLYNGGLLAARYDSRADGASVWLVRSYGSRIKARPGLRIAFSDRTFHADAPFTYEPADRRRLLPSLSLTIWQPRYVRDRFISYLGPQEDFQVGSWVAGRVGLSARRLGSDRHYPFLALTVAPRHRFGSGWYLFGSLAGSSRWRDGTYWQLITSTQILAYRRFPAWPLAPTLAARLAYDTLSRPENVGSQFLLGGLNGLRGYGPRRFDGTRRWTAGVELRPLLLRRPSWALGAAVFGDVGNAWTPPAGGVEPHPAAGIGLRLGLPRIYDTPILRADLARGLRGGIWQLSFGLGQYL